MAEYIKREAAIEICETEYRDRLRMFDYCGDTVAWNIGSEIKALPAVDVVPVVHGRWVEQEKYTFGVMYDCSICGNRILDTGHSWNYCPNCGSRMDGDSDAKEN